MIIFIKDVEKPTDKDIVKVFGNVNDICYMSGFKKYQQVRTDVDDKVKAKDTLDLMKVSKVTDIFVLDDEYVKLISYYNSVDYDETKPELIKRIDLRYYKMGKTIYGEDTQKDYGTLTVVSKI